MSAAFSFPTNVRIILMKNSMFTCNTIPFRHQKPLGYDCNLSSVMNKNVPFTTLAQRCLDDLMTLLEVVKHPQNISGVEHPVVDIGLHHYRSNDYVIVKIARTHTVNSGEYAGMFSITTTRALSFSTLWILNVFLSAVQYWLFKLWSEASFCTKTASVISII